MASIFTRIIAGELPAFKVFEDEWTLAILALDQVNPGHTLMIPKIEVDHWWQVPEPHYSHLQTQAQRVGKAQMKAFGCPRVGTLVAGFEVPHFHLHLIPAWSIPDLDFRRAKRLTNDQMAEILSKLKSHLE